MDGLRAFLNWGTLGNRASVYWGLLNPAFLFLPSQFPMPGLAPSPWILLTPMAGLMLAGGYRMISSRISPTSFLLLGGYAVAPLAASSFGEADAIGRASALLVFAVLIAASGAAWLVLAPKGLVRAAGIGLLALIPVQFAYFHRGPAGVSPVATARPANP